VSSQNILETTLTGTAGAIAYMSAGKISLH
jgi:hypothetical protein